MINFNPDHRTTKLNIQLAFLLTTYAVKAYKIRMKTWESKHNQSCLFWLPVICYRLADVLCIQWGMPIAQPHPQGHSHFFNVVNITLRSVEWPGTEARVCDATTV